MDPYNEPQELQGGPQESIEVPVTLFLTKEKFFKNSRRALVLTPARVLSFEGEQKKLNIAYREIQDVKPGQKPAQFNLKTPQMVESYLAEKPTYKNDCLAILYEYRKKIAKKGGEAEQRLPFIQVKPNSEYIETEVLVGYIEVAKLDGDRIYSSKYLKDIATLYRFESENDCFGIVFSDESQSYYKVQGQTVESVIEFLKSLLKKYYAKEAVVKQAKSVEELLPAPLELSPDERLFGFPVKKFCKRTESVESRILCLTKTNICVCEGATVISSHPLTEISKVSIYEDDRTKFQIEFKRSTKAIPSTFYCDERDTIISNIMGVAPSASYDFSGIHTTYHIRGSLHFTADSNESEDYFLRRLMKASASSPDLFSTLKEFNHYIPTTHTIQVKDKRTLPHVFDILRTFLAKFLQRPGQSPAIVIELLQTIQRLLSSKNNYNEIRTLKDVTRTFSELIRAKDDALLCATTQTLLCIIEAPKLFGKDSKAEYQNKSVFFSTDDKVSPICTTLFHTLIQFNNETTQDPPKSHTLALSCLLDLLVSVASTHSQTTEKIWFREFIPKIGRGSLFDALVSLCRSPCFEVALKATTILKVLFVHIPQDQFSNLQDSAREKLALLFQIYQAVDSRIQSQRLLSAELVGLMCENNTASMQLIRRIFPPGLAHCLETKPEGKSTRRIALRGSDRVTDSSRTKLNWEGLFRTAATDTTLPYLVWNSETRKELAASIHEEISGYERDKENNREIKKVWNHEEYEVLYPTLERQLIVDDLYLETILDQPSDLELLSPPDFLNHCFHKLLLETNSTYRVRYASVMGWCVSKYSEKIGKISFNENLVNLLQSYINSGSSAQPETTALLEFISKSFKCDKNIREFIDFNGPVVAAAVLPQVHTPPLEGSHHQVVVCLKVLLLATRFVNSVDDRGLIKIPIPKAKRALGDPKILSLVVRCLATQNDSLVDHAANLLAAILDKNSGKAKFLHKHTGVLYFLFAYRGNVAGVSISRLLQTLHSQQDPHLLSRFIPDSISHFLQNTDAEQFSDAFYGTRVTPEIIWTDAMRELLQSSVERHISGFLSELERNPSAVYQPEDMEPIEYPGLDQELRAGNYYIRNIIEHPEWSIEEPESVLRDALNALPKESRYRQKLLLSTCSVLFRSRQNRQCDAFVNFAFYPLILKLLELDRERPDLTEENVELISTTAELIYYSLWTSNDNLTNFLKLKGLSVLCNLLWCCSRNLQIPGCYNILEFVLKIVLRLIPNPITREQIAVNSDIIRDILSCLTVNQPEGIILLSMQCLIEFSQDLHLAESVYKHGGHFYLMDFILSFDPNAELAGQQTPQNQAAAQACLVLGNISGIFNPEGQPKTSAEEKLQRTLNQLFTKGMVDLMKSQTEGQFLMSINQVYETPISIWNEQTRNELARFIRERIQVHQHSSEEESELKFTFLAHAQEFQVDGIFLRLFLNRPDWKLQNPHSFLTALLNALSENMGVPTNLAMLLGSIYQVLNSTQGLEKMIVAPSALDHFFTILLGGSETSELHPYVLSIFLHATANQACVDAMCTPQRLHHFATFFQRGSRESAGILLDVLSNMVSSSSKAIAGISSSGILLYLLSFLVEVDVGADQIRTQTVGVLKQTKSSSLVDTRFADHMGLFFPRYLVSVLDRPVGEFLHFYSQNMTTPDIIWNDANRNAAKEHVLDARRQFESIASSSSSSALEWNPLSVKPINWAEFNQQLLIGGVYIDIYNQLPPGQSPFYRLHNPRLFLEEVLAALGAANLAADGILIQRLALSLHQLIVHAPYWANFIGDQPIQSMQTLLGLFQSSTGETQGALLGVFVVLVHSPSCRKKLLSLNTLGALFSVLTSTGQGNAQAEEILTRMIYLLIKKDPLFIKQLFESKGLATLLQMVNSNSNAGKYALAIIRNVGADRKYDQQLRELLGPRDVLLQDRSKLPPSDWIEVPVLTNAHLKPYIAPVGAEMRAPPSNSLNRTGTSSLLLNNSGAGIAPPPSTPQTMAPLPRQDYSYPSQSQYQQQTSIPSAPIYSPPPPPSSEGGGSIALEKSPVHPGPSSSEGMISSPQVALSSGGPPAPPPPPKAGPPPPPPPVVPFGDLPPRATGGRADLLADIAKGKKLRSVATPTPEERKKTIQETSTVPGDNLMSALAGALKARRGALVTTAAANPFADEEDEADPQDTWED